MIHLQIRPSDCDSLDHVNNSAYVAYVQHVLAEMLSQHGFAADWTEGGLYCWVMQDLAMEYRLASSFGNQLAARIWLAEPDSLQPAFGVEIVRDDGDGNQTVIRSRSSWQRQETSTGQPVPLPDSLLKSMAGEVGVLPRTFKEPGEAGEVRRYEWQHQVERAEVGLGGRVHPHVLFEWIEESVLSASATAGWPIERCLASDFVVFQMRHDSQIFSPLTLGDRVKITSRLIDFRRLRGTWQNEIRDATNDRLLVNNYSTGVFLNLAGRPTSPPPGMMEALQSS